MCKIIGEGVGETALVGGATDDAEVIGTDDAVAHEGEVAAAQRRALGVEGQEADNVTSVAGGARNEDMRFPSCGKALPPGGKPGPGAEGRSRSTGLFDRRE